ncbi:MAG: M20/M25/M40 family metallo-hydrolase [Candidatus Cloacimonetes bacterium]|nr:M20/M25/M40 family metallo-hydrolase [Candidatus Cloacimonadota bacterium]
MLNPYNVIKNLDFERIAGSEGEKKALEVITHYLEQFGITAQYDAFELFGFDAGNAEVECNGRYFDVTPFGLIESCTVKGTLVMVENPDIITVNRGAYRGKILMGYGYPGKIASQLEEQGVVAYIAIGRPQREASSLSIRQKNYQEGYVPSVSISHEEALKLMRFTQEEVTLRIKQAIERRVANNIVIDILGKGLDDNLTVAVGHYDTVAHSCGASDNGGGIVALLALAEHFAKHQPQRDLRIIFCSGEELGLLGSKHYVEENLDEIKKRVGLVVNIDVSGDSIGTDRFIVTGCKELCGYVDGSAREAGLFFKTDVDIYSSDSIHFAKHGIPAVNIARFGGRASNLIHTPGDNLKNVSRKGYLSTMNASINLLDRVLNSPIYPVKEGMDSSLQEKMEKYLWNSTGEKPELDWTPKYKQ